MEEDGKKTLNNLFDIIDKRFSSKDITVYREPEKRNTGKGLRIIVQNNQINVYEVDNADWEIAYQWMDKTSKKLLEILIKKVTVLG